MSDETQTPMVMKTLRVPEQLWLDAQLIAASRGETLSDVLRASLTRYVKRHQP